MAAAKKKSGKKKSATAPRSHIIRQEDPDKFLAEVNEYFDKGFRPIQEMAAFAELDGKSGKWRTLFVMPLVHFEEFKEFQTVPLGEGVDEERMFG